MSRLLLAFVIVLSSAFAIGAADLHAASRTLENVSAARAQDVHVQWLKYEEDGQTYLVLNAYEPYRSSTSIAALHLEVPLESVPGSRAAHAFLDALENGEEQTTFGSWKPGTVTEWTNVLEKLTSRTELWFYGRNIISFEVSDLVKSVYARQGYPSEDDPVFPHLTRGVLAVLDAAGDAVTSIDAGTDRTLGAVDDASHVPQYKVVRLANVGSDTVHVDESTTILDGYVPAGAFTLRPNEETTRLLRYESAVFSTIREPGSPEFAYVTNDRHFHALQQRPRHADDLRGHTGSMLSAVGLRSLFGRDVAPYPIAFAFGGILIALLFIVSRSYVPVLSRGPGRLPTRHAGEMPLIYIRSSTKRRVRTFRSAITWWKRKALSAASHHTSQGVRFLSTPARTIRKVITDSIRNPRIKIQESSTHSLPPPGNGRLDDVDQKSDPSDATTDIHIRTFPDLDAPLQPHIDIPDRKLNAQIYSSHTERHEKSRDGFYSYKNLYPVPSGGYSHVDAGDGLPGNSRPEVRHVGGEMNATSPAKERLRSSLDRIRQKAADTIGSIDLSSVRIGAFARRPQFLAAVADRVRSALSASIEKSRAVAASAYRGTVINPKNRIKRAASIVADLPSNSARAAERSRRIVAVSISRALLSRWRSVRHFAGRARKDGTNRITEWRREAEQLLINVYLYREFHSTPLVPRDAVQCIERIRRLTVELESSEMSPAAASKRLRKEVKRLARRLGSDLNHDLLPPTTTNFQTLWALRMLVSVLAEPTDDLGAVVRPWLCGAELVLDHDGREGIGPTIPEFLSMMRR